MGGIQLNNGPVLSPYLNLLRGGSFLGNYYGLVQPQVQFYNSIQGLGQQVSGLQQSFEDQSQGGQFPLATGHNIRFLNTSHYFNNFGGPETTTTGRNLRPLMPPARGGTRGGGGANVRAFTR
jgi:hypothetical protein